MEKDETTQLGVGFDVPTIWFKTEQIETTVNTRDGMTIEQLKACRRKLIVLHQCGDDKEALVKQLETMILGLKTNFENFAN